MKLLFATNNIHKVKEIRHALNRRITLVTLHDIGFEGDIPETGKTIKDNAVQKASFIHNHYRINCFADDTGLEIDALNGEPGVFSARYAGESCNFEDNIRKVLSAMRNQHNRKARFRTVIALILNDKLLTFEGVVEGMILYKKRGDSGFGYDPIFQPEGLNKTFAEISLEEKNKISHRATAIRKLSDFLAISC
ncbi:MAG: non-canonical purine NTP diphosphatase [Bacteroidales bacterium]|nr:non-canonical purine NTP diphosphatase [Bacteroidales bacterium]MBN2764036.1 non-canonical purine NTP diphosphatase [Bacteroidales bacterium]